MKLIDIANKIDKSPRNEDWIDTEKLGHELGLPDIPYVSQDRVKCYWIGKWHCTDTYVGYRLYFFDDTPVAYSSQTGRKMQETFQWFSREAAREVKTYLLSLLTEEVEEDITICDIHEDIGETFKIHYSSQIVDYDRVLFHDQKVDIIERVKNEPYGIDTELKIKLPNGEEKHVDVEELDFGFCLDQQG